MVTIYRGHGLQVVIFVDDHEPAHVHITGAGAAKINLLGPGGEPELIYSVGIKRGDMRPLMAEVAKQASHFLEEWELIHGQGDGHPVRGR